MPVTHFPDPRRAPKDGLLAVGGDLHPKSLLLAYSQGIFPWPVHDPTEPEPILAWFCPNPRAILRFSDLHVPESLARAQKRSQRKGPSLWRFSVDEAFEEVILACSQVPRPGQDGTQTGTWITQEMIDAYIEFHHQGFAHSVEVWEGPELIGGLYGVDVGGAFAGESMFYRKPNASKLALLYLIEHLKKRGASWIDIQMLTPHMKALGAVEIKRDDFLNELSRTHALGLRLFR
jgi:leucyl/phenylalanyl-tRNA--protein transferase